MEMIERALTPHSWGSFRAWLCPAGVEDLNSHRPNVVKRLTDGVSIIATPDAAAIGTRRVEYGLRRVIAQSAHSFVVLSRFGPSKSHPNYECC